MSREEDQVFCLSSDWVPGAGILHWPVLRIRDPGLVLFLPLDPDPEKILMRIRIRDPGSFNPRSGIRDKKIEFGNPG